MARKSRKACVATKSEILTEEHIFRTAIYVRLSEEDERKIENESVENQIAFLQDFVEKNLTLTLGDFYVDRGITGTKFDRPEFNRMIGDIKAGKINCVVVKDLSRLGRNYIEAGEYIEKIFPFFGVRFIAVIDNYDSLTSKPNEEGLAVPLKNLINEAYAKDISRKICTTNENRFKQGIFPATKIAYGFVRDPENKHNILVDENVREVIIRIFTEYIGGANMTQIARGLNDDGILSPYAYQQQKGMTGKGDGLHLWNQRRIHYILCNPVYAGDAQIAKTRRHFYLGMENRVKREDGYYFKGHHEAIVDEDIFELAQKMLQKSKDQRSAAVESNKEIRQYKEDFLQGKLFCADCGNRLIMNRNARRVKNGVRYYNWYECARTSTYGEQDPSKYVKVEKVENLVMELIRQHVAVYMDARGRMKILNQKPYAIAKRDLLEKRCGEFKERRARIENFIGNLYEDYADGIFSEDEYFEMKAGYVAELEELEDLLAGAEAELATYSVEYEGNTDMADVFTRYLGVETLNRELVQAFIKRIICYGKDRFEVEYNFADEFRSFFELVELRGEERE
jgi:DNA invertase Pin-like site-specific DNA recombinase